MRAHSIMYHDVVENGDFASSGFPGEGAHVYKLRREDFERHLDAIAKTGRGAEVPSPHVRRWRRQLSSPDRGPSGSAPVARPLLHHHGSDRHARLSRRGANPRPASPRPHHRQSLRFASDAHGRTHARRPRSRMEREYRASGAIVGEPVTVAIRSWRLLLARGGAERAGSGHSQRSSPASPRRT